MRGYERIVVLLVLVALAACQHVDQATDGKTRVDLLLNLGLEKLQQGLEFDQRMTHFQLKIFPGPTSDPTDSTIFDSGCLQYQGDNFEVQDIEVGENRVVFFQGFKDANCATPTIIGARGGVSITEQVPQSGFFYLHLTPVGGFSLMPTPETSEVEALAGFPCSSNAQCKELNSASYCSGQGNVCRLDSYFPLNMGVPRGLHQASSLENGLVVFTGGFSKENATLPGQYSASSIIQVFNPMTMLFEKRERLSDKSGATGYGLHEQIHFDKNHVMTIGGFNEVKFKVTGGRVNPIPTVPTSGCVNDLCVLTGIRVLDFGRDEFTANKLPSGLAGMVAALVEGGTNPRVLIGSGWTDQPQNPFSKDAYNCGFNGTSNDCTQNSITLIGRRRGASGFCLKESSNGCDEYVIIGGNPGTDNTPLMEGIDLKSNTTFQITATGETPVTAYRPIVVKVGASFYMFGGSDESKSQNAKPNIPPMKITFTGTSAKFERLDLTGVDEKETYRVYHQVLVLKDGRALLIGGVDANQIATDSVLVFLGGKYTNKNKLNRARFGHTVSVLRAGLLQGAALIAGGFGIEGNKLVPLGAAELYYPD